ncbi:MAG: Rab family GTPase [Candidatus Hermodarchaeota archaeon]
MEDKNSPPPARQKTIEEKVSDDSVADEIEEFYHKVKVDLEQALSGNSDYLSIIQEAFSQSIKTEKDHIEDFRRFGLIQAEKKEEIYLISCFRNSGYPLFDFPLSDKVDHQESLGFILSAIKNYVKFKLGEIIEVLALESQTIHFFMVEKAYIISIVTSKYVSRDRVATLAVQIARLIRQYPEEKPQTNPTLRAAINRLIEVTKATFIREHHTLKIILIGDGAVGKTSIRRQYLGEGFKQDYQMTIGADLAAKKSSIIYTGGRQIKFVIWDLAGQPRFSNVRKAYYMAAVGALVVFDMTRMESLQNIVLWMNELWRNNGSGPVPLIVLGNKKDLCEFDSHCISEQKVIAFVERLSQISQRHRGFNIHFLTTSAKTGHNIEQAFELLGEAIMDFLTTTKKQKK